MNFIEKIKSKFIKKKFVCPGAFTQAYIYHDGRVFLCPDCLMSPQAEIGNLNNEPFEKIWNSKKAVQIRKEILKGKYNFCGPPYCYSKSNYNIRLVPIKNVEYKPVLDKFPRMVCIGADWECNANCIMCRKELCRLSDEDLKIFNERIEKQYIPILKDAEELTVSTTGDPFASRNTRLLMKTAAEKYPNLKFSLITNGIMCDKFNCDEFGITNRLSSVMVSVHASNEETYNKIVGHGNFKKVQENLEWLKSLKEEKKIKGLYLAFVVSAKNYDDIPAFIEFAKKYNAVALFWGCFDWGGNLKHSDEPLDLLRPDNPKREKLKEVLNSIELETEYSHFSIQLRRLKTNKI